MKFELNWAEFSSHLFFVHVKPSKSYRGHDITNNIRTNSLLIPMLKWKHFQVRKQIGVMITALINIQTSIKLYSKSFSNCLMKHFHTGIHWDIKKWGWYNQWRLESIQYWILRLWIMLIFIFSSTFYLILANVIHSKLGGWIEWMI